MVRQVGLEPTRLATLEPKSSVSTNFTTGAHIFTDTLSYNELNRYLHSD